MASARVTFFANVSGGIEDNRNEFLARFSRGGSIKWRIGMRMAMPAAFTMKNIPNCCRICRDRDSGYVQKRLPMKLLMTAQIKETEPANTSLIEKTWVNRFITPKSIIEPNAPTAANFRKRLLSFGSFKANRVPALT